MNKLSAYFIGLLLLVMSGVSASAASVTGKTQGLDRTLLGALHQIARQTGRPVEVISGCRRGGRRGSLHRTCQAADIRIAGLRPSTVRSAARQIPTLGGIGIYSSGHVHVDVRRNARIEWVNNRTTSVALRRGGRIQMAALRSSPRQARVARAARSEAVQVAQVSAPATGNTSPHYDMLEGAPRQAN